MGTIVLHAGIPKAGSSSIQEWLSRHSAALRRLYGIFVLVARCEQDSSARPTEAAPRVSLTLHEKGSVNLGSVVQQYLALEGNKEGITQQFFEQLDRAADRYPFVVLSDEALAHLFRRCEMIFLRGLERLASRHHIRIAYYVRPQHTALEAAWRQWGFRTGLKPSRYLADRARQLHYYSTYVAMRRAIPKVSFTVRPFRRDLLDSGSVVLDFAHRFLNLSDSPLLHTDLWVNRGLPLEIVNLLRNIPAGVLWESIHDNTRLTRLKRIVGRLEVPESEKIQKSRRILQRYCYETFEMDNLRLIAALGWQTDHFIPPVDPLFQSPLQDLSALDALWKPSASEAELQFLCTLLNHILSDENKDADNLGHQTQGPRT
ncbi:MAG: hypothetical protein WHS86_00075 [Desulfosoma sp.]